MKSVSNNMLRKVEQMCSKPGKLQIGLIGTVDGNLEPEPGSMRVAITANGVVMKMTSRQARGLAETFEKNPETAKRQMEWIPETLRQVADDIDAQRQKLN